MIAELDNRPKNRYLLRLFSYHKPHLDGMLWVDLLCILPLASRVGYTHSPLELYLKHKHFAVLKFLVSSFVFFNISGAC